MMDALTFIVEIIKATVWPATIITIAMLFRGEWQGLIGRIKKSILGSIASEFEEAVRELQQEMPELAKATPIQEPTITLASSDPRAVIIGSWLEVEEALVTLARKTGHYNALAYPAPTPPTPLQLARALQRDHVLEPRYASLFNELRSLGNSASREPNFNPSADSVLAFAHMASTLAATFMRLAKERSSLPKATASESGHAA